MMDRVDVSGRTDRVELSKSSSGAPSRVRRLPKYWIGIVVVIELLVLFAAAEFMASFLLPPAQHYINPQMLMEPDARRIYFHRPNQRAFTIDKPFNTNSLGFRDGREVPVEKGGEFRILALGDSLTVGLGVGEEDAYPRQLESLLHGTARPIRVVNGAVTCYATWQEVEVLKEKGALVHPDIVLLAFYWNDLYPKPGTVVPIAQEKSGEQQDATQKYLRLFKASRTLLFLRERWAALSNQIWPSVDWSHREMIYNGGTSPYLEQAYNDVRRSVEEFASLRREGFLPVLVILPIPMQVQSSDAPSTAMQQRIEAIAKQSGVRTLDLLPAMRQAYAENPDMYIAWDYEHLTPRGHRVVAAALHQYLMGEKLVAPATEQPAVRNTSGSLRGRDKSA